MAENKNSQENKEKRGEKERLWEFSSKKREENPKKQNPRK